MAGSANTPKTFGKKVKHQSNDIKNLYSLTSQKRSISSTKARVWGSATSLGNPNAGNARINGWMKLIIGFFCFISIKISEREVNKYKIRAQNVPVRIKKVKISTKPLE